jgi:hypothetical protein
MSEPIQPRPPGPPSPPPPPVPQYGEYAPAGYVPPKPAPGYEAAAFAGQPAAAPGRKRRTWDLVLTIVLFVLGFFGALFGVIYGVVFSDPDLLDQVFQTMGYGDFNGQIGSAPAVLIVSHTVLYLIAVGGGLVLLLRKRVAFWLPLAIGVIAAIIFWATVYSVFLSDPGLVGQLTK